MGGFHARIIAAGSRLGRSYLAEQGKVGRREAGAVSRTRPIQPVRLCGPPGTIYTDFPGTGPDNRPSGHLRRGGTTRIAESIGAARRNLSGGMTAIRPMQRRERAIDGGRYLNRAYGMRIGRASGRERVGKYV